MKIFREEKFGGIVYDTKTLRYTLIREKELPVDKILPLKKYFERSDIISAPIRVYFEITRKCNLHCEHCFASAGKNQIDGLPNKELIKLIDEFAESGVLELRITGGEPTQREGWHNILKRARDQGISVSLNTNGVYDNLEDTISKFLELDLNQVTVSIDGLESTHDSIRGIGSYDQMIKSVELMKSKNIPLRFNTVITRRNYLEIPEIIELASNLVSEINFFYMRPIGRALKLSNEMLTFEEHYQSAVDTLKLKSKYAHLNIMHFEQSFRERSIIEKKDPIDLRRTFPYVSTTIGITCKGEYVPHGYSPYQDKNLTLGKYPQDTLLNIWHSSEKLDNQRIWFSNMLKQCTDCEEYNTRCAGLNFEMKVAENKGHIIKNPYCITDKTFESLGGANG